MPTPLGFIQDFAGRVGSAVVDEVNYVGRRAVILGRVGEAIGDSFTTPPKAFSVDAFEDWAGQSVGRIEKAGVYFATSHYTHEVIPGVVTRGSRVDFLTPGDTLLTSKANLASVPRSMADLEARGFRSVIDLRLEGRGDQLPVGSRLNIHRIPILDNAAPTDAQGMDFLTFIRNPKNQPCYYHCEAGVGRTGVMTALALMDQGIVPGTHRHYTASEAILETEHPGIVLFMNLINLSTGRKYTMEEAMPFSQTIGTMLPNQIAFIKTFAAAHGYPA